jgi:hypothetical protein
VWFVVGFAAGAVAVAVARPEERFTPTDPATLRARALR